MKKILLASLNSRFNQTNLAIRSLMGYAKQNIANCNIDLLELNINQSLNDIIRSVVEAEPNMLLFSVYIWNIELTLKAIDEINKILPSTCIGLGGPEASYKAVDILAGHKSLDFIVDGEGELTFAELVRNYIDHGANKLLFLDSLASVKGLYVKSGKIVYTGKRPLIQDLSILPFPYTVDGTVHGLIASHINPQNNITYFEASRGCPFKCTYCLSSITGPIRYLPLQYVISAIKFFLDNKFKIVKFTDRTFNLQADRYLAIWDYIIKNHNGITAFHFEISPHALDEKVFSILKDAKPGSIQFELGIQSINMATLQSIKRKADVEQIGNVLNKIPESIHVHLDLIAGLPYEDLDSFRKSFNFTINFFPNMLQLGFLKILGGTEIEKECKENTGYLYLSCPPYEILQTPFLSYADITKLKGLELLLDIYYNSGNFLYTMKFLIMNNWSMFDFFLDFANYLNEKKLLYMPHKVQNHFQHIIDFFGEKSHKPLADDNIGLYECLKLDFLCLGKAGRFPAWYSRSYSKAAHDLALHTNTKVLSSRQSYALSEYEAFDTNLVLLLTSDKKPSHIVFETKKTAVLILYPEINSSKSNYLSSKGIQFIWLESDFL